MKVIIKYNKVIKALLMAKVYLAMKNSVKWKRGSVQKEEDN